MVEGRLGGQEATIRGEEWCEEKGLAPGSEQQAKWRGLAE